LTGTALCPDEETLLAFVEGRQSDVARSATASHVDGCAACQDVVTAVAPALLSGTAADSGPAQHARTAQALERGATVGRYLVLALVGRGGMGEVYAAYDPELDRKIALKLLHAGGGADVAAGRARLLREAKAAARLSHPNVVVVHDAGAVGGRVYIAMEYVDGRTVAEWARERRRDWREVRDVFLAAGRGLAAAHAAGLVHRDFKPHNVMIARDGTVRVMDFGLASASGVGDDGSSSSAKEAPSDEGDAASTARLAGMALTRTGLLLGTPAYMAPEQFRAEPADASTDQFGFCVSLFEALYGERPFGGASLAELASAVKNGKLREPSQPGRAPAWIRRLVQRGLAARREERFPSMDALLAALTDDPAERWKKWAAGAAIAAAVLGLVAGAHRIGRGEQALCTGAAARVAGIWDAGGGASERKATIHRAFAASGRSYAEQAFRGVSRLLDDYVARWRSMYQETCEATNVRREQSAEVLDLRMGCLNERLGNLRALSDVFASADGQVVENAVSAAAALPRIDRCADVQLLQAVVKPPEDPSTRRQVDDLRGELARMIAIRDSGQCRRVEPLADQLIARARSLAYEPLLAETLSAAGAIGDQCGNAPLMVERFKEAHTAANASSHDEIAALSSTQLVIHAVNRLGDVALARVWLDVARGDVARFGRRGFPAALLFEAEGELAVADRRFDRALGRIDEALSVLRSTLGPEHPWTLLAEMNKGDWLERAGRLDDALAADRSTIERFERAEGSEHPDVAIATNNLGEVLNLLGRYDEAEAAYGRALAISRRNGVGPEIVGWILTGLGRARLGLARPEAAVSPLEEALAIRTERRAPPEELGETRFQLARALWPRAAERKRALGLAAAAREQLRGNSKAVAEIDAWLAQVRGTI
jgi:tetratricopeptide (TPR) repeat protein